MVIELQEIETVNILNSAKKMLYNMLSAGLPLFRIIIFSIFNKLLRFGIFAFRDNKIDTWLKV